MRSALARWIDQQLRRVEIASGTQTVVVNNHATQIVYLEGNDTVQDGQIADLDGRLTALEANVLTRTRFRGTWSSLDTYALSDQAYSNGWLAWSKIDGNTDDMEPAPAGNKRWLTGKGDTFNTWANTGVVVSNTILVGFRVTPPVEQMYIRYNVRVYVPPLAAGLKLSIWAVVDPTGDVTKQVNVVPEFLLTGAEEDTTIVFPLGADFLQPGVTLDVIAVFTSDQESAAFGGEWVAVREVNPSAPASGQATFGNQQANGMRFHYQPEVGTNQEAELRLLSTADHITYDGLDYELLTDPTANADDLRIVTSPHLRPPNGQHQFDFTRYGPATIPIRDDGLAWAGDDNIQGLYSETGYADIILSQRMYNVDLEVDEAVASPNWFYQAFNG